MKKPSKRLLLSLLTIAILAILMRGVINSLPSGQITIFTGPQGATFYRMAQAYQAQLEQDGYEVEIVALADTAELASRVNNSSEPNSVGFSIGQVEQTRLPNLQSLGFVDIQPLFLFYSNSSGSLVSLATLKGRKIVMPARQSITSQKALQILDLYGITPDNTPISFLPFQQAIDTLLRGEFYAMFLMLGADNPAIEKLMNEPTLNTFNYVNSEGVLKRFKDLTKVVIAPGSYDVLRQIPPEPVELIAGKVELIANKNLDKAAAYTILRTLDDFHHNATLTSAPGEYPQYAGTTVEAYPVVQSYSKTGIPWLYRTFPGWLAVLIDKYLILGIAIFLLTEVYRSLRYLYEFIELSAQTTALNIIRRHNKRKATGKKTGSLSMAGVRWARAVVRRQTIRQRAQRLLEDKTNQHEKNP